MTSTFTIIWGISSYKINVTQTEQKICDKFVLMVRSSVDIVARLKHLTLNANGGGNEMKPAGNTLH